jgi:hypothetical protein
MALKAANQGRGLFEYRQKNSFCRELNDVENLTAILKADIRALLPSSSRRIVGAQQDSLVRYTRAKAGSTPVP